MNQVHRHSTCYCMTSDNHFGYICKDNCNTWEIIAHQDHTLGEDGEVDKNIQTTGEDAQVNFVHYFFLLCHDSRHFVFSLTDLPMYGTVGYAFWFIIPY